MRIHIYLILTLFLFSACDFLEKQKSDHSSEIPEGYFEGEITLTESKGLYGSILQVQIVYNISENRLKREEHFRVANQSLGDYAGLIIDLKKDSVVFYFANEVTGKYIKHTLSIKEYQEFLKTDNLPPSTPSPFDQTFNVLPEYHLANQVKDSTQIKGFNADYSLFKDKHKIFKQEVFDTKKIKVKREMLELAFIGLPKEVNFPLVSEFRTTISDLSNDSIVGGRHSRALDQFTRSVIQGDSTANVKSDLEKLAKNKWINRGLKLLKKGVDMKFHITVELGKISSQITPDVEFSLPSKPFTETVDFDEFLSFLPVPSNDDFDFDD